MGLPVLGGDTEEVGDLVHTSFIDDIIHAGSIVLRDTHTGRPAERKMFLEETLPNTAIPTNHQSI